MSDISYRAPHPPPTAGPYADCMIFTLREAWLTARAVVTHALAEHQLSVAQYTALLAIRETAGASVSDIARTLAATRQTAAQLVAGLVQSGSVRREADPSDGRAHRLYLTRAGSRQLAAAEPAVKQAELRIEDGLTEDTRAAGRRWLHHLVAASVE